MTHAKQYVTFLYPGIFLSEEETRAVETRDVGGLAVPEGAFAFQFFERLEIDVDGERLVGKPRNRSGRYYPEGRVMTVADVLLDERDNRILISNMEGNGWDRVVKTRCGNYQPFTDDDVVLP